MPRSPRPTRRILSVLDEEKATKILQNVHGAISADAKLLVLESVIPPGNQPFFGTRFELAMPVIPGGMERAEVEDWQRFEAAGFRLSKIVPTGTEVNVRRREGGD